MSDTALSVGSDGLISEPQPLASILQSLPTEVGGIRKHAVAHTCVDVSSRYLAVGSEQGYVWVLDIISGRLMRELSDFRGTVVTAVRLNHPKHEYIAYGTDEGIVRVESITRLMARKHTARDREGRPVSCLVWGSEGEYLYCGFVSGRLLEFHFQFDQEVMKATPLLDCGSPVVQLSVSGRNLLVSTLARSLMLEADTGRWTQVGTKERKVGPYGGSFSSGGGKAYLARPGLRVWTADKRGKVLLTAKFRDALSASHLPSIPTQTWPSSSSADTQHLDGWQFTLVHSWLDQFVVTFQDNLLLVLDLENIAVAGILVLEQKITCVTTSGSHIYILCGKSSKPLTRLTIHPSFIRARGGGDGASNVADTPQDVKTSEQEVRPQESSVVVGETGKLTPADTSPQHDGSLIPEPNSSKPHSGTSTPELSVGGVGTELREMLKPALGRLTSLLPPGKGRRWLGGEKEKEGGEGFELIEQQAKVREPTSKPGSDTATPVELSGEPQEHHRVEMHLKDVLKFSKLLHGGETTPPDSPSVVRSSPAITSQEHARRLRMAQAGDEEELVVSDKSRKKKRKRKTKKASSRCSSASTSLERLTDIAEDQPISNNSTPPSLTPMSLGDDNTLVEEHPSELTTSNQLAGEQLASEEVIAATTARESIEQKTQQLADTEPEKQSVESFDGSTPTQTQGKDGAIQAGDQRKEELVAVGASGDDSQPIKEEGEGSAGKGGGEIPNEEELLEIMMQPGFEDTSLLESVVDTAHTAIARETTPNYLSPDHETPSELSDNPLYLDEPNTEVESSLTGTNSQKQDQPISANIDIKSAEKRSTHPRPQLLSSSDPSDRVDPFSNFSHSPEYSLSVQPLGCNESHPLSVEAATPMTSTMEQSKAMREGSADLEASDSSHDSDPDNQATMFDSVVVSDYYKLCGTLVQNSSQKTQEQKQTLKGRMAPFAHRRESTSSTESLEDLSQQEMAPGADIWVPIPHPSRTHLQCVCLSEELLWVVDIRGMVFCTTTESKGRDWQMIKRSMQQVSSSASGKIVWGIHHQNAYVRLGIGMNPAGSTWRNITKGTTIAHKIKHIAVDETGVWAIKIDGQVLFRKGVSESNPEGRVWQEVGHAAGFTYLACCREIIWAVTSSGKVFIRDGITPTSPSGKKWTEVKAPKLMAVALTTNGVVWGIDHDSQMGFRSGITRKKPKGKGPWWEVTISALTHPSSPYNSLWQVMSTELGGSQLLASLPSVSSLVPSYPAQHKLVDLSASANVGVVVLEGGSKLHACWRSATGYHYTSACKDGVFQLTTWVKVAAGSTALWLVRDDGELYCLTPEQKLLRIDCSNRVSLMAASTSVLWVQLKDAVWSRQGMTLEDPEGISWDYIELSTQLHEKKLRHIACGKRAVWAIDSAGVPHFRFGVHAREPGTGMSPAWVPVEDNPNPLLQIAVSPDDWLVWACDLNWKVYVRTAVTQDFPVGVSWELVPGEHVKELCAASRKVYALTPSGNLLCRFGISEGNVQGNYWRRMPGKYAHITTSPSGDLWTLDEKGQVWRQEWRAMVVSQDPGASRGELEMSMVVDQTWEVV